MIKVLATYLSGSLALVHGEDVPAGYVLLTPTNPWWEKHKNIKVKQLSISTIYRPNSRLSLNVTVLRIFDMRNKQYCLDSKHPNDVVVFEVGEAINKLKLIDFNALLDLPNDFM